MNQNTSEYYSINIDGYKELGRGNLYNYNVINANILDLK